MIVVDIIGTMAVAGVSLNAVSLVNLVICVGIGVEFCAHIARAFMFPSRRILERTPTKFRGKDARAWTALVNVGGSVFNGITITKLLGVCVLAFTWSKIFEIYYFRVWLALVIFAATHALILLPVALSYLGGEGKFCNSWTPSSFLALCLEACLTPAVTFDLLRICRSPDRWWS
jgi:Niemann-Pick C1 protein